MTIPEFSKTDKILVIRLSSLGDILLVTPVVRALKNKNPGISIDFLLREEYSDALKLNNNLDNLYFYKRDGRFKAGLLESLKMNKYDFVFDLQNNYRSREICSALKVKTFRFFKHSLDKFLLVNFKINRLKNTKQIPFRYAGTIGELALDERGIDLYTDKFPDKIISGKNNLIGFCPGARHFTKRWPADYFVKLGNLLTQYGFTVLLFGGKSDRQLCSEISGQITTSYDLSNNNDLLQTVADMKSCKIIVGNDSGLIHAASSTNAKIIVIFGSTVREFGFAPFNCDHLILENNLLTCRPCSHIGKEICPKKHFNCMKTIEPETVFMKIQTFLS